MVIGLPNHGYNMPYGMNTGNGVNLGVPSFGADGTLSAPPEAQKFKMPDINAVKANMPGVPTLQPQAQTFQGNQQQQKSGVGPLTGALAMGGAAGLGWHGVQKFYNPDVTENGDRLAKLAKEHRLSQLGASIKSNNGKLSLLKEIEAQPDAEKLSTEAKALKESLEKRGITVEQAKERLAKIVEGKNQSIKFLQDGVPKDVPQGVSNGVIKAGTLPEPAAIQKNEKLVETLTKAAKTKWGKIAAGAAALISLAYMTFKD